MPTVFNFQYRFHTAGQGIFASGTVGEQGGQRLFHWVVDCGSIAPKTVLRPAVQRYRDLVVENHLDLLCVSHFDKDHVSGLNDLLESLHIDTVVLPYYSALERLLLGARSGSNDDEYREFIGNPIAFLLERAASIGQVIIVGETPPEATTQVAVPDRPPILDGGSPPSDGPAHRDGWRFKLDSELSRNVNFVIDGTTLELAKQCNTEILISPGPLKGFAMSPTGSADWEFLFFHKPIDTSIMQSIRDEVAQLIRGRGVSRTYAKNITKALSSSRNRKRIRDIYVSNIGGDESTIENINSTSLCVYSGPELSKFAGGRISEAWPNAIIGSSRPFQFWSDFWLDNCSILYTGDANFSISANRYELYAFLTSRRREQIGILQVPHHGSRNNWEAGASQEFNHHSSVFCADEHHIKYKHPHREVMLDLIHHGPVIANKSLGWSWRGRAQFN